MEITKEWLKEKRDLKKFVEGWNKIFKVIDSVIPGALSATEKSPHRG